MFRDILLKMNRYIKGYIIGIIDNPKANTPHFREYTLLDGMKARRVKHTTKNPLNEIAGRLFDKYKYFEKTISLKFNEIAGDICDNFFNNDKKDVSKNFRDVIKERAIGYNTKAREGQKGFNRLLLDTGTLYKNIKQKKARESV